MRVSIAEIGLISLGRKILKLDFQQKFTLQYFSIKLNIQTQRETHHLVHNLNLHSQKSTCNFFFLIVTNFEYIIIQTLNQKILYLYP